MNTLIQTIKTKILNNKKNILFVVFFMLLLSVDNTFAEAMSKNTEDNLNTVIDIGNIIFALGGVLIGIMTQFVGLFLQPGWTTGSVIGLDIHLKRLWVLVSNIIYFVFAFLLIVIAFMNIIGKGENTYQMKTALPHFIVGILIVPFSWFIVQFVLSISALLTVSALSLPWDMFGKGNTSFNAIEIPKSCTINVDKMMGGEKGTEKDKIAPAEKEATGDKTVTTARSEMGFTCLTGSTNTTTIGQLMSNGDNLFSIMYVYSYGIMRVQDMDKLFVGRVAEKRTTNLGSMAANVIFNGLFVIRFLILLIALAIAMFSRGVVLWLFTIFSPVFGLLYFFNGKAPEAMKGLSDLSFKDFLGLAMVPVYVGLALSFGLLFSFVATNGLSINQSGPTTSQTNTITGDKITIGGMELNIQGRALGSYKEMAEGGTAGNMAQQTAKGRAGFIRQLFIDLIAIAVLWMAVMAALGSSKITKSVVDPIAKFGTSIGQTAMKLPQYAPIPFMGGQSMKSLEQIGHMPGSILETKVSERANKMRPGIEKLFGGKSVDPTKVNEINTILQGGITTAREMKDIQEKMKYMVNEYGRDNSQVQELEKKVAEQIKNSKNIDNLGLAQFKIKQDQIIDDKGQINQTELAKAIMGVRDGDSNINKYINAKTSGQLKDETSSDTNPSKTGSNGGSTNIVVNNIKHNNIELTDENGHIIKGKEKDLAEYLISDNRKINETDIKTTFHGGNIDELIKELKDKGYFTKAEEKAKTE